VQVLQLTSLPDVLGWYPQRKYLISLKIDKSRKSRKNEEKRALSHMIFASFMKLGSGPEEELKFYCDPDTVSKIEFARTPDCNPCTRITFGNGMEQLVSECVGDVKRKVEALSRD